jgi:hypothetical protein
MGGIVITPDMTYDAVRMEAEDLLLMPGADKWQAPECVPLLDFARDLIVRGTRPSSATAT